jgi:hypothetical protein
MYNKHPWKPKVGVVYMFTSKHEIVVGRWSLAEG